MIAALVGGSRAGLESVWQGREPREPSVATIVDCGSTNGTLVNGKPIARAAMVRLVGGETITLGRLQTTFETPAAFLALVSGMVSA